jgi:hypothetical protein
MSPIVNFLTDNRVKGIVSLIAAVIMYFTPDNIDAIIQTGLIAYGATVLMIVEKKDDKA